MSKTAIMNELKWIDSNGGPLILLAENLLRYWDGSDPPKDGRKIESKFRWNPAQPSSDYDRACDISDYLGVLRVGSGYALVLGDEPLSTAWWSIPNTDNGLVVRWVASENEQTVLKCLEELPIERFPKYTVTVDIHLFPLILFDSAYSGTDINDEICLRICFPQGTFGVSTLIYTSEVDLVLHLFKRLRQA